jgi:hypothetical protein
MQQSAQPMGSMAYLCHRWRVKPPKMFWYGIQWHLTDTGIPRMQKIQADDPTIDISPGDNPTCTESIKRIEITKGMRTLGVRLAPTLMIMTKSRITWRKLP